MIAEEPITPAELSCQELVELVTEYFEGTLGERERRRFDEHVGGCEPCQIYLDQMRATIAALGRLPEESISPAARDELLRVFRTWKSVS